MKRVTNAILPMRIKGISLADVRKMLFKFKQDDHEVISNIPPIESLSSMRTSWV